MDKGATHERHATKFYAKPSVTQPSTLIQRKAHSQGPFLSHLTDVEGDYSTKSEQEQSHQQSLCPHKTTGDSPSMLKPMAFLTMSI